MARIYKVSVHNLAQVLAADIAKSLDDYLRAASEKTLAEAEPKRSLEDEILGWTWDEFADTCEFSDPHGLAELMREVGIPASTEDVMKVFAQACTDLSVWRGEDCAFKLRRTRGGWRWQRVVPEDWQTERGR